MTSASPLATTILNFRSWIACGDSRAKLYIIFHCSFARISISDYSSSRIVLLMCLKAVSAGVRVGSIELVIFLYEIGTDYFGIRYYGKVHCIRYAVIRVWFSDVYATIFIGMALFNIGGYPNVDIVYLLHAGNNSCRGSEICIYMVL